MGSALVSLLPGRAALRGLLPRVGPPLLVVGLVACALVPLPTPLVDLLLSVSLAGSVLLLVAAMAIGRSNEFLGFPSLLLLLTLYRLALNLSTTRLILSQADAGRVIDAFAGIVVRSDLVVGGVMFAIITVIQYLVIARGAERVAEVGARFALDGLPGHQAAIDADLRSGAISIRQAADRRARLIERSRFYGAMDGSIRFVKGDAVAGLVITAVNLVGGLAVGVFRHDLPVAASLDVYGRLTIGDGLLAQIPALLVSLAAGILVARVDREDETDPRALPWLEPAMLLVPAVLLFGLGAVPGMPTLAFSTTAVGLLAVGWVLALGRGRIAPTLEPRIVVRAPLAAGVEPRRLQRALEELRRRCEEALGVAIPEIGFEDADERLSVRFGERILVQGADGSRLDVDGVVLACFRAIMDDAPALFDLHDVERTVELARAERPAVVAAALAHVSLSEVLAIVRGFLRERIPVPSMAAVLGVVADLHTAPAEDERRRLPERVRTELARHWLPAILATLTRKGPIVLVRPTPDFEETLLAHRGEDTWSTHVVEPVAPLREALAAALDREPTTLVVVRPRGRVAVASLLWSRRPHVFVVATTELERAGLPDGVRTRWIAPPDDATAAPA